jgi:hypothetical protein
MVPSFADVSMYWTSRDLTTSNAVDFSTLFRRYGGYLTVLQVYLIPNEEARLTVDAILANHEP